MCHIPQKVFFSDNSKILFFFFKKWGLRGFFLKSVLKSALKDTYKTCVTSLKKIFFKKLKILSFFSKGRLRGSKMKI